jgi:hypothetical protein
LVTVELTTGLTFQPLTSTRKIVLCSLVLPFVLLFLEMLPVRGVYTSRLRLALPALLLTAAILWIIWPVLQRQQGVAIWLMALPVGLYAMAQMFAVQILNRQRFRSQAAYALMLAVGTGITALIAAAALYSQMAFASAAATGAVIVVLLVAARATTPPLGIFVMYAAAVPVTLLASAATVYAQLPVLVLLCLALVPLFAGWLPLRIPQQRWLELTVTCLWTSIPLLPAIWLVWRAAGPVSF